MNLHWLLWRVFNLLLALLLWLLLPANAQQPAAAQPELEAAARTFVAEMAEGHFEKAVGRFDETMTKAMPARKLEETWKGVIAQLGALEEVTGATHLQAQGYHIVDLACRFERTRFTTRVVFNSAGRISGLFFRPIQAQPAAPWTPATSVKPETFEERPVTVGAAPWELPGTLTLPRGEGPFPAVVLVHGSGAHDQDESIGPNKPFKDLAWGLASRGVAVLRYEKRNHKYPAEFAAIQGLTLRDEVIEDAQRAVTLLASTAEIDGKRIFVAGHSLGAMLAPRIAVTGQGVAGIVVMAGNSRPLGVLLVEQVNYLAQLDGQVSEAERERIAAIEQAVAEISRPDLKVDQVVEVLGSKRPGSYWLDFSGYRPAEVAAKLSIPILVLQGERDYQVRMADFEGWRKALAGQAGALCKSYPALNHLFVAGSGPSAPAEYAKAGHVADEVIQDIAAWVLAQTPKP